MSRLLILTPAELTRDPRARRAAIAALKRGVGVCGLCVAGAPPAPLDGVPVQRIPPDALTRARSPASTGGPPADRPLTREVRGCFRVARLVRTTVRLSWAGRRYGATIVHANDFETLPAAAWMARGGKARLVYDAHELYTRFEARPPRIWSVVQRRLERICARRADAVVTVSPEIALRLQQIHRLGKRPLVTLNCPPLTPLTSPSNSPEPLRVVYQASVGPNRHLDDLFSAASAATGAHVTIRVAGADQEELRRLAATAGAFERIVVRDPVAPGGLVEALAPYDVGVVIDRRATDNTELALPNKLFEYLMAGLAVVAPRLAAMTSLIESERIGLTYEPGNPQDLARALNELAADRPRLEEMKRRAREAAVTRYNAEAQEPVLLEAWGLS